VTRGHWYEAGRLGAAPTRSLAKASRAEPTAALSDISARSGQSRQPPFCVVAFHMGLVGICTVTRLERRETGACRSRVRGSVLVGWATLGCLLVAGTALGALVAPKPLLSKARLLVAASVGNGFTAHVWLAPSSTGGQCLFVTRDHNASLSHPSAFEDGGCSNKGPLSPVFSGDGLNVGVSVAERPVSGQTSNWVPPTVSGSVLAKLNVVRVRITWTGGFEPLKLGHDSFVGGGVDLYQPPFARLPLSVVAYNAKGHVVATAKLDSASLELMSEKVFATKYAGWRAAHSRH